MPDIDFLKFTNTRYNGPSFTIYNRLEANPRSNDFGRNLRAEVRDALWMLTRQWQFGEFQGEDAGAPVSAKVLTLHRTPDKVILSDGQELPYDQTLPLEATVERESQPPTLWLRIQLGRQWKKFLKAFGVAQHLGHFLERFPLPPPPETDPEGQELYLLSQGKVADGYALHQQLQATLSDFVTWLQARAGIPDSDKKKIKDQCAPAFLQWYNSLYLQPGEDQSAWQPERMEYGFSLDIPFRSNQKERLIAEGYPGGRLDWYDMDLRHIPEAVLSTHLGAIPGEEKTNVFLPSMVQFRGMPHPRFWQMEEGRTDFGKIENSPTGLLGLLLAEYGLNYSNDWFLLPYPMPINTMCAVRGILVTDVFGKRHYILPARTAPETNWQQFALYHLTIDGRPLTPQQAFYLPAVTGQVQHSDPIERVHFMRDEMANMVWAIETIVPSEAGGGKTQAGQIQGEELQKNEGSELSRYVLASVAPENWTPFIPVHKKNSPSEIRLQRAQWPYGLPPQGRLLSEVQPVHFIEEEEIPRSGIIVERAYHRTRWFNGKTICWIGRQKTVGRGEANSGLGYDGLVD